MCTPYPADQQLIAPLKSVLSHILKKHFSTQQSNPTLNIAVALSGGPDSIALAHALHMVVPLIPLASLTIPAQKSPFDVPDKATISSIKIIALHVHHGLDPQADSWQLLCSAFCQRYGLSFSSQQVAVGKQTGLGIEGAARQVRYQALFAMCKQQDINHLILAHHLDDQIETVLFRLLRGTGLDGAAGMPELSVQEHIELHRPWLHIARHAVLDYVARHQLPSVYDPSNRDSKYARGIMRTKILPVISEYWPSYRVTLNRFAHLARQASKVLASVADQDLTMLSEHHPSWGLCLNMPGFETLIPERQLMVLRRWLAAAHQPMPSEKRLYELQQQLLKAGENRHVCVTHENVQIRRYRHLIVMQPLTINAKDRAAQFELNHPSNEPDLLKWQRLKNHQVNSISMAFKWDGQPQLFFDALGGRLLFELAQTGIDPEWLKQQSLSLRQRQGSDRLRLAPKAKSQRLKQMFQAKGIPPWVRESTPVLAYNEDAYTEHMLWVPYLGLDCRVPLASPGIVLQWNNALP